MRQIMFMLPDCSQTRHKRGLEACMHHGTPQHSTFLAASSSFRLYEPFLIEPQTPRMCMLPVVVSLRSWAAQCCGACRTCRITLIRLSEGGSYQIGRRSMR